MTAQPTARSAPLRVAMVSEHASPLAAIGGVDAGGQNVHVAAIALALGRLGAEVVVHTRRDDPDLPRRVRLGPNVFVDHVAAGPPRAVRKDELLPFMDAFADDLARRWARRRPDVVHAHFWMSGHAALAAAEPLGIPVVQTFHALGTVKRRHQGARDTSPPERLATERAIVAGAAHIVATCADEVHELIALGADPTRVSVVPCGVDLGAFTPDGPAEPRGAPHRVVVIGRLVERKGVDDVVAALPGLPGTELVIAGGPDRDRLDEDAEARRLRERADRLGVGGRVVLRGSVARPDVPTLLRSADVVACAPWYEPFGIVPLEAMACGVPVVASAVGGLLDTVVEGVTGLRVPPRRPDLLAEAMRFLLAHPRRRQRMGATGVRRARALYGWDRVAEATWDAYGLAVADGAPLAVELPARAATVDAAASGALR